MAYDYDPKDAVQVWDKGTYEGVLIKTEDKTSKVKPDGSGGNPMEAWTFRAYHPDGREQLLTEYVVIPAAVFKIKQLAKAIGQEQAFLAGQFHAEDHLNSNVMLEIVVEESAGYDDKNRINKFVPVAKPAPQGDGVPGSTEVKKFDRKPAARGPSSAPVASDSPVAEFDPAEIPFVWQGRQSQGI